MKKILIIEDDFQILDSTSEFLQEEGFKVYKASDGVEGIQKALEIIPDLILCDVTMPKKSGFEVCKTLQSVSSTATIPFIFLTAKSLRDDVRLGMQLGADDYLTKPFEYSELLKVINIRLDKTERIYKQTDERFYSLIDNPLTGVFIYQNNKFVYSNAKLTEILGYKKDELNFLSFPDIACEEGTDEAVEKINACINGYPETVYTQLKVNKKDGDEILIELFGCLIKLKGKECLMGNIREVKSGNAAKLNNDDDTDISILSERETEVLRLICLGLSTPEIAEKLILSPRTIESHRAKLISKTKSKNTPDLVMFALRNGLITM